MQAPLLTDIVIVLALSIGVLILAAKLRLPIVVGFLLTGILAGPKGFGIITSLHDIEQVADIGVIFLLFTIGLEFSLHQFYPLKRAALIGGFLQVFLTIFLVAILGHWIGLAWNTSVFLGFLLALSSTAIVLKTYQEKAEIDSPHGRISIAILIFQDIVIVLMMISVPILAGKEDFDSLALALLAAKGIGILVLVFICSQYLVPWLLRQVAVTRSRELFLITIVTLCLSITGITGYLGLSPSLGAFLAGLILADSIYSQQALGGILPLKELFSSFFFITIGMLFDIQLIWQKSSLMILGLLLVIALKIGVTTFSIIILRYSLRTALLVGFGLAQVGEFSFVLSKAGMDNHLIPTGLYQIFIGVSVLSMAMTPFLIVHSHRFAELILRLPLPVWLKEGSGFQIPSSTEKLVDHIIIVGYGANGRNLAKAARSANIPYHIIEMNAETVRREQSRNEPIFYGDSTNEEILHQANLGSARILVIAITDPVAVRRTITIAREMNPALYIIARTRFISEMKPLLELGADYVIPEEFETSIEIFTHVLQKYLVPHNDIEAFIQNIRADGYKVFYNPTPAESLYDLKNKMINMDIICMRLEEGSAAENHTLREMNWRKEHGVTILAMSREQEIISNPDGETIMHKGDLIYMLGNEKNIVSVKDRFIKI